jgi:predicted DNA-binding transcriptional regulator AlpA
MKANEVRPRTITLIGKLIRPWIDEGIISVPEGREIIANLKHLAQRGTILPAMEPKFLTQEEAATMLGICKSNFKKMEAEGKLPIRRRKVGTSVRYCNTDILEFMLTDDKEIEGTI